MNDPDLDRELRYGLDELTAHLVATMDLDARLAEIGRRPVAAQRLPVADRPDQRPADRIGGPSLSTVIASAAAMIVVCLVAAVLVDGVRPDTTACGSGPGPWEVTFPAGPGGECVGITDGSNIDVLAAGGFDGPLRAIHTENERVRSTLGHPVVTVVFVGDLTTDSPEADQLDGLAQAQQRRNRLAGPEEPMVRLLLANAGTDLRYGLRAAHELGRLASTDPTIIGVVWLGEYSAPALDMVRALHRAGLMVISPGPPSGVTAADPWYAQFTETYRREADMVAAYVSHLRELGGSSAVGGPVRIITPSPSDDVYLNTLVGDYQAALVTTSGPPDPRLEGPETEWWMEDLCESGDPVIYAGHSHNFSTLLAAVAEHCPTTPPLIIAASLVTDRPATPIPYRYVVSSTESGPVAENYDSMLSTAFANGRWVSALVESHTDEPVTIRSSADPSQVVSCGASDDSSEPWCP